MNSKILSVFLIFSLNFYVFSNGQTRAIEYYEKAREYYLANKYYDAIDELLEATKINPNYYEAYKFIAEIYYKLKIYFQAQFFIEKAYPMSNNDIGYKILYANILFKNNKIDEAKKHYSEILLKQKNNTEALIGLASIFEKEGLLVAAANYYITILEYNQNNYEAFENLLNIYEKLEMNDKVRYLINKVKGSFIYSPEFYKRSAEFYINIKDLTNAETYADNYLILVSGTYKDMGLLDAHKLLAIIYMHQFRYNDAVSILQKAIIISKNSEELYYLLGYSYIKLEDFDKAILNLEKARNTKKDLEFYSIALEESFFISNFRSLLSNDSNIEISKNYEKQGLISFRNLNLEKAIKNTKNAVDIYPRNDNARFLLSKIYKLMKLEVMAYEELYYLKNQRNTTDTRIIDFYDVLSFEIRKSLFYRYRYRTIDDFNKLYNERSVYKIGIFTQNESKIYGSNDLILRHAERMLERNSNIEVVNYNFDYNKNKDYLINSFSEGFSYARNNELDLFLIFDINLDIPSNSSNISVNVYSGKTGVKVETFTYNTGGASYLTDVLNSISKDFYKYLPKKGKILQIKNDSILINLGSINSVEKGDVFLVLKDGALKHNNESSSFVSYEKSDILGEIIVEEVADYISLGNLKSTALLRDYIQEGDTVFIKK